LGIADGGTFLVAVSTEDPSTVADSKLRAMVLRSVLQSNYEENLRLLASQETEEMARVLNGDCPQQQLRYDTSGAVSTPSFLRPFEDLLLEAFLFAPPVDSEWFRPFQYTSQVVHRVDILRPPCFATQQPLVTHLPLGSSAGEGSQLPVVPRSIGRILQVGAAALLQHAGAQFDVGVDPDLQAQQLVVHHFQGLLSPLVVVLSAMMVPNEPALLSATYFRSPRVGDPPGAKDPPLYMAPPESLRHLYFPSYRVTGQSDAIPQDLLGVLGASAAALRSSFSTQPMALAAPAVPPEGPAKGMPGRAASHMPDAPLHSKRGRRFREGEKIVSSRGPEAARPSEGDGAMAVQPTPPAARGPTPPPAPTPPPSAHPTPPAALPHRPPSAVRKSGRFMRERLGEFTTDPAAPLPPIQLPAKAPLVPHQGLDVVPQHPDLGSIPQMGPDLRCETPFEEASDPALDVTETPSDIHLTTWDDSAQKAKVSEVKLAKLRLQQQIDVLADHNPHNLNDELDAAAAGHFDDSGRVTPSLNALAQSVCH